MIALFGVPAAILVAAGFVAGGVIAIARLEVKGRGAVDHSNGAAPIAAVAAGAADLARLVPPGGVIALVFAQTFVRGALTVLTVVLALDVLLLGEAAVGWLTAATGVGGLVGGFAAGAILTVDRLARGFVAGLILWAVIREGDPGDRYHIVLSGTAAVTVRGSDRGRLARGQGFGEIALLRNVPRTASVTAEGLLQTVSLPRDEFLAAIGSSGAASAAAELSTKDRLAADHGAGA